MSFSWDFEGPLASDDLGLIDALRSDLESAGYSALGVEELLGSFAMEQLMQERLAPGRLALRGLSVQQRDSALAVMAAWWLFAVPQKREDLARAFPGLGMSGLESLGLLLPARTASLASGHGDSEGELVAPAVDLRPHESDDIGTIFIASDLGNHHQPGALPKNYVLGVGQASLTLLRAVIREPVCRALDLGTGCGIQAFHLLAHAEHVTATDLSERALNFTAFNLLLNRQSLRLFDDEGRCRVTLLAGNLLEPVAGERFDLIVSNPPFVITPRPQGEGSSPAGEENPNLYTYRDGGMRADGLVEKLVREIGDFLDDGGVAQMLGNWEVPREQDGLERVRSWIGTGIHGWVIQRELVSTGAYAMTWLGDASPTWESEDDLEALAAYEEDFRSRDIESVGFGYILLHRPLPKARSLGESSLMEEITHPIEEPVGNSLGEGLRRRALLAEAEEIGSWHVIPAPDVTQETHQRPGAEHPEVILLRQGSGLRRTRILSSEMAGLVGAADGELSLAQIAGALEAILEEDALAEALLDQARDFIAEGFLVLEE